MKLLGFGLILFLGVSGMNQAFAGNTPGKASGDLHQRIQEAKKADQAAYRKFNTVNNISETLLVAPLLTGFPVFSAITGESGGFVRPLVGAVTGSAVGLATAALTVPPGLALGAVAYVCDRDFTKKADYTHKLEMEYISQDRDQVNGDQANVALDIAPENSSADSASSSGSSAL